ncbi:MAG: L-arabinose ABC transporter permease AraH [Fimbriimonadaceae bacterium]|nr:L-arabinose ABC transporter permease AraH [Chthonomonadaceae bacterium]MCO5296259.1 L-arabinose ABC transporter permease AraH [Fimbriimonadaceae bacterium]
MKRANWLATAWDSGGMVLLFLALFAYASFGVGNFFTPTNLVYALGLSVTTTGIVACGMLFCLAAGDFDLSVGSVAAFAGMLVAVLLDAMGGSLWAVPLCLAACACVGLFNGLIIAVFGINALITTLATMQIVRGLAYLLKDGNSLGISSEAFAGLGTGDFLGLPIPLWVLLGCLAVFGFTLHMTVFGRNALAIGGNREAARLAGVPTARTQMLIFTLQATLAGLAGVVSAAQQQLGDPKGMVGLELRVISACVLGGVSLTGGIGSIHHVIVGVLIMGTVQNIMDLKSVPTFYQYLVSGAILLAAVLLDRLKRRGVRA